MAISPSSTLIGLQVYSSATPPKPKPAGTAESGVPERFDVEDLVDIRGERSQPGRPRPEAAKIAAKTDHSGDAPSQRAPASESNAAGQREAPGVLQARHRPPGSLINILA